MSNKPDWDRSVDGPNPVLADRDAHNKAITRQQALLLLSPEARLAYLDSIQAEAVNLSNSRGAEFMTPEQHFLARWQDVATVAAASLHVYQDARKTVENRKERITEQLRNLATALYKLGRTAEALMVATPFPDLVDRINWIQAAIDHDDDLTHDCPRPVVGTMVHNGQEIELTANRRSNEEDVFSEKHGALVHVWVCSVCGEANATVETPERQQLHDSLHAAIDRDFQAGKPLTKYEALLGS